MCRVVRACSCVHSQDCNSAAECTKVEIGRKDLQLGVQVGSIQALLV